VKKRATVGEIRKDRGPRAVDAELSILTRTALQHRTVVAHEDSKIRCGLGASTAPVCLLFSPKVARSGKETLTRTQ